MKVTISDIASAAEVSKSTVSKVINDHPSISTQTKEKVNKIMKEMNYFPNAMATQLAKQSSSRIAILIEAEKKDYYLNTFFYNIIGGAESIIFSQNYSLEICNINNFKSSHEFIEKHVYSKKVDGIIIPLSIINETIVTTLNNIDFPFVVVGRPNVDYLMNWVDIDNILGGEIAGSHLIENGYENIAFIGGQLEGIITKYRYLGIEMGLKNYNKSIKTEYLKTGLNGEAEGYKLMKELLTLKTPPDSIICVDNYTAFGALLAIKESAKLIPKDIGIVTFDNYPLAKYTTPSLTAINIDTFELGKKAAEMLFETINSPNLNNRINLIRPEIIIRESTNRNAK